MTADDAYPGGDEFPRKVPGGSRVLAENCSEVTIANPERAYRAKLALANWLAGHLEVATPGRTERDQEAIRHAAELVATYVKLRPDQFIRTLVETGGLELVRETHSFPFHGEEEPCLPTCRAEYRGPAVGRGRPRRPG